MHRPAIALPISQHFNVVFPKLADIIDVFLVRNIKLLPSNLADYSYRKAYHANGLINIQFEEEMNNGFINFLNHNGFYHISFDCGPSCRDVYFHPSKNDIYWPTNLNETLKPEEIIKIAKERIEFIKSRFSGTIALENLDYHKGGAYEHVCDPDFITEILKKLDAYFTIDIGHILVTTFNLGIKPLEYIARLPLERIREVHLSHPNSGNDKHDCPTSYEYKLLEYILSNSSPDFIALEYYRDPKKIIGENIKLHRFLNK